MDIKSLVSSSWNTCAYFCNTGFICFSSLGKWSSFPAKSFLYRASFFPFPWGLVGDSVSNYFSAFIWSISVSDTYSATPSTVALGKVSFSWLKLANITYTLLADVSVFALKAVTSAVSCRALLYLIWFAHEQKIPPEWVLSLAGYIIWKEILLLSPSPTSLWPRVDISARWLHLVPPWQAMIYYNVWSFPREGFPNCAHYSLAPPCTSEGVYHSVSFRNGVRAACFVDILSHAYGALLMPANDIFPTSNLISAPVLPRTSLPNSPSDSVGRGTQKCVAKFSTAYSKLDVLLSLYVEGFFCNPIRFHSSEADVTPRHTSLKYGYVKNVSIIKRLSSPSISKETVGVPCSSRTVTVGLTTAFSGASRYRKLSSLSPLTRFPESLSLCWLPFPSRKEFVTGQAWPAWTSARFTPGRLLRFPAL